MFINLYQINSELDNDRLMFCNLKTILTANRYRHIYMNVFLAVSLMFKMLKTYLEYLI